MAAELFDTTVMSIRGKINTVNPLRFKDQHTEIKRRAEAKRILEKYPDRIPIIVEKAPNSTAPNIDKIKYLVPCDLNFGQFVYVVRKRIKLNSSEALFLFVSNNTLPPTQAIMSQIYKQYKDADDFLYITYHNESTFG